MVEKAWPPECEAASHIASPVRNQRELNTASWLTSSFFIQFNSPAHEVLPPTFWEGLPCPSETCCVSLRANCHGCLVLDILHMGVLQVNHE